MCLCNNVPYYIPIQPLDLRPKKRSNGVVAASKQKWFFEQSLSSILAQIRCIPGCLRHEKFVVKAVSWLRATKDDLSISKIAIKRPCVRIIHWIMNIILSFILSWAKIQT